MKTARDVIVAARGKFTKKVIAETTVNNHSYEIIAFGYENYPEPQYFTVSVDGVGVEKSNGELFISYFDDEAVNAIDNSSARALLHTILDEDGITW